MIPFSFRLLALGLKFCCPLAIVYLASQSELGEYYLSTTFLTVVVMLIALEIAVPFSALYLRARSQRAKRRVFTGLILTQGSVSGALSLVPALVCYFLAHPPLTILFMLPCVFMIESCSNEVGRFFWNIGQSSLASRRDLLRAVALTSAVLVSVVLTKHIVTPVSLLMLSGFNLLILSGDMHQWGDNFAGVYHQIRFSRRTMTRLGGTVRSSLMVSAPLVLHGQILTLQPLLERYLIERKLGLAFVGGYSFQYSIIQTGASLLIMPSYAALRKVILGHMNEPTSHFPHQAALKFTFRVMGLISVLALGAYFTVPILALILKKSITSDATIIVAAALAGGVNTFSAALSPLFARKDRLFLANIMTLLAMAPLAVVIVIPVFDNVSQKLMVLGIISFCALLQGGIRLWYSFTNANSHQREVRY